MTTLPKAAPIYFLAECHADTAVLSVARGRDPRQTRHVKGVSRVANEMLRRPDAVIIGMVDDDEHRKVARLNTPDYFRPFVPVADAPRVPQLAFLKHPDRAHYLIRVTPACEKWLLDCLLLAQVRPSGYGFTGDTLPDLLAITKREDSDTDSRLLSLLKALRRAQVEPFRQLQEFVGRFEEQAKWQG